MASTGELGFAVTAPGLEEVLAEELEALGATVLARERGGVSVRLDRAALYRVHFHGRIAVRVRVRLGKFRSKNLEMLAQGVRALPWDRFAHPRQRITVQVAGGRPGAGVARKVEHAIRDALRGGRAPPSRAAGPGAGPPSRLPPVDVLVRSDGDQVEVSVDASGERLHRRGWRRDVTEAPLRENLAAAVLHLAQWHPGEALVDPMCGSGTFPIEAATIALAQPPGAGRSFAFEGWPSHDRELWARIRAERGVPVSSPTILGFDLDESAIDAARANARRAHVADRIVLRRAGVDALELPETPGLVVVNPPYGARLSGAKAAWRSLGEVLRARAVGWRAALLVPDPALLRATGLVLPRIARFDNGGIDIALHVGPVGATTEGGAGGGGRGRGRRDIGG
jgi:putative N6-adenine-specific DNA methylase